MTARPHHLLALLLALSIGASAAAQPPAGPAPVFAGIFSDHAVLQRQRPIAVWGTAGAKQTVTVTLAGRSSRVRADARGRWRATLPAMAAGGPYRLSASGGGGTTTLSDVKVGDVYLCSGQSNMEFPARLSTGAWSGLSGSANDNLRFVTVAHDSAPAPLDDLRHPAPWQVVSPATVGEASAVCYYMARSLQKTEHVPVGFIHASWGGTTIQGWIGGPSLASLPAYAERVKSVGLLATDPAAARVQEEKRQEAWWTAHDPAAPAEHAWIAPDFDDAAWATTTPSPSSPDTGAGVTWYRTSVTLTEAQARAGTALRLGPIDSYDNAWVNGVWVGSSNVDWVWRDYPMPAGVLKPGRNTVVLRVLGKRGMTGQPDARGIATGEGQLIPLPAAWRYHAGTRMAPQTGPAVPWSVPSSLTTLYNAMIAPLRGYGFTLAAWYQGESNAGQATEYRTLLPLMIADWRRSLGHPDLPFLVVQLTAYGKPATQPGESDWAMLRQAQADTVARDPHAALAVTIDVGDRTDIHPTQKTVVGERLARAARAMAYGEAITPGGPEATAVTRRGDDLVVAFRHTNGGLRTYSADVAIGFEACGAAGCRFVGGQVQGDTVVLRGANRPDVSRVRYAWTDAPTVNLFGAEDLPAAPFELPVPAR